MQPLLKEYRPGEPTAPDLWAILELPSRGPRLHTLIHEGLPYAFFDRITRVLGMDKKDLSLHAGIPPATLARRAKAGRFTPEESDRLFALADILHAAQNLFEGDLAAASQWMAAPVLGLGSKAPVSMVTTRVDVEAVIDLIGRMEHGVVA